MLCTLSRTFPKHAAKFLERDKGLTRNFREESVTDQLMAALVPYEKDGITVDYPDETITGGDMEWIFVAPRETGGCKYFRLMIQAKRAQEAKRKKPYYYYHHLDHGAPKGAQANTLINYASSTSGTTATFPLYAFYHPKSALSGAIKGLPATEGVNMVFADVVQPVVNGGCSCKKKKVEYWRPHFMTLPDFLCWPTVSTRKAPIDNSTIAFSTGDDIAARPRLRLRSFHPDLVAEAVNLLRRPGEKTPLQNVRASSTTEFPDYIRRAVDGDVRPVDRRHMPRPRVIFRTDLTSEDPMFFSEREAIRRRLSNRQ
jgi:hypothetical protein